ncbi:MAG: LVIVD repeat-containing protein [Actinomycetota bacterium]
MRRALALICLCAATIAPTGSQAAALPFAIVPAGTGVLTSPNVQLLFTIPDEGMVGGHFFGGHYFAATVANFDPFAPSPHGGVRIYDTSNPELPTLVGVLVLPHGENEAVDLSQSRKFLLVSMETYARAYGGQIAGNTWPVKDHLYVISIADPTKPTQIGSLDYPTTVPDLNGNPVEGPGHIATCIQDCKQYAYVTGANNGAIYVVDLRNPTKPFIRTTISGSVNHAAFRGTQGESTGYVHHVDIDRYGQAWVTGKGGTAQLDIRNPLKPRPIRWLFRTDNYDLNHTIHHNAELLDQRTLLVTEEDFLEPQCGKPYAASSVVDPINGVSPARIPYAPTDVLPSTVRPREQGQFETWRIQKYRTGSGGITRLGQWNVEMTDYETLTNSDNATRYANGSSPAQLICSSHWFTFNSHKIVAVGWYNQGVRFLDVSDPRNIRQVGYFIGPATQASAAYFVPGHDDLVYVADYDRGFDVLKLVGNQHTLPTVQAPIRAEWLSDPVTFNVFVPRQGFGCLVPRLSPLARRDESF